MLSTLLLAACIFDGTPSPEQYMEQWAEASCACSTEQGSWYLTSQGRNPTTDEQCVDLTLDLYAEWGYADFDRWDDGDGACVDPDAWDACRPVINDALDCDPELLYAEHPECNPENVIGPCED